MPYPRQSAKAVANRSESAVLPRGFIPPSQFGSNLPHKDETRGDRSTPDGPSQAGPNVVCRGVPVAYTLWALLSVFAFWEFCV